MTEVRAIIERILRLKAEQDALGEDIREIYAEAKSSGFDKTALGQAVALIRKREKKGADALDELDALVSTYLAAFDGGTEDATRGRVRAREAAPAPAAEPDPPPMPNSAPLAAAVVPPPSDADLEIPPFLRRAKPAEAVS